MSEIKIIPFKGNNEVVITGNSEELYEYCQSVVMQVLQDLENVLTKEDLMGVKYTDTYNSFTDEFKLTITVDNPTESNRIAVVATIKLNLEKAGSTFKEFI